MIEQERLTPTGEAKWLAEFEGLGREAVRLGITRGFVPDRKRELAILWLREKEIESDQRGRALTWYAKWTWDAALAAAVLAAIGMVVGVFSLFK